jgi:xanthine dehydrogenase small subunit
MAAHAGSQCGYCTPGFVVSLFAEQYRPGRTESCDPHALSGNLCRCTGYRPIRDAALALGPAPEGWFRERLQQPAPGMAGVGYECGETKFLRPETIAECVKLLKEFPEARLVAGGTDLVVESNLRDRRFPVLISLEALADLRAFEDDAAGVTLGAGLSLSEIGEQWSNAPPVLEEWLRLFASPLIRNRATLGGNLGTASPIGDSAPLLLALDASLQIGGEDGLRSVPLSEFFRGYRETALRKGEVLIAVRIPKPLRSETRFYKVAKRRTDDISTVAAAISITVDGAGRVARARFAYGGVAATPIRAIEAEDAVLGKSWNPGTVRVAQDIIGRTLKPMSDHRGSAAYRLAMAQSLLEKYAFEQSSEVAA